MDHKVSKDMISSGMIPSGEKTQADLGRTQYGSAPSPSKLMDAYKSMYGKKEEVINEMAGKGMGMTPAPKPNAGGIAKPKAGGIAKPKPPLPTPVEKDSSSPAPKTDSRMDQVKKQGFAKSYRKIGPKSETEDMLDKVKDRQVEKAVNRDKDVRRSRASYIMTKYGESVDLLAAYRSVYEHHKKDADGNTIPHEDEEVNEGKIPAGLQAYLDKKKGKKEDKKDMKEDVDLFDVVSDIFVAEGYEKKDAYKVMSQLTEEQLNEVAISGTIATLGAGLLKGMLGAGKVAAAAGKGALSAGKAVAAKGMTAAKTVGKGITSAAKTGMSKASDALGKVSNIAKDKTKGMGDTMKNIGKGIGDDVKNEVKRKILQGDDGGSNKITKTGTMSAGSYQAASADLFDIVKGQLLDEGLSEEEIKDIMLTLTPDEIMEELSDIVKRNDALNRERAMKAAQERKTPENVRAAQKRQYTAGGPKDKGENKYTTQDKKTIIDYHKNKESM